MLMGWFVYCLSDVVADLLRAALRAEEVLPGEEVEEDDAELPGVDLAVVERI